MNTLPLELVGIIIKHVQISDLPSVYRTCNTFRCIMRNPHFKSNHTLHRWNISKIINAFANKCNNTNCIYDRCLIILDTYQILNTEYGVTFIKTFLKFRKTVIKKMKELTSTLDFDPSLVNYRDQLFLDLTLKLL